jgi:hypothetical protein
MKRLPPFCDIVRIRKTAADGMVTEPQARIERLVYASEKKYNMTMMPGVDDHWEW